MRLFCLFSSLIFCFDSVGQATNDTQKVSNHLAQIPKDSLSKDLKATELKTVFVASPILKYKNDSIENRILYRKTYADAAVKTKGHVIQSGIAFDVPLALLADAISGKRKRDKKFLKTIKEDEQAQYVAIFYNKERIVKNLKISDSTANVFLLQNPMPYDFVRNAKSIEIDMWIREHFIAFGRKNKTL